MVHGLVAQLGGGLTIDSAPGRGTTIDLWLPISAGPILGEERTLAAAAPATTGRGTALLVDDEELVRLSTADMLTDLGFEVIEAGSAEEALRLLEAGTTPNLLITDHLMPGMNGADLAREARALRPALPVLPVLIVSGYAEVEGIAPDMPRLTKPFRNAELLPSHDRQDVGYQGIYETCARQGWAARNRAVLACAVWVLPVMDDRDT
jgi:CheY-like chemotaxis protein